MKLAYARQFGHSFPNLQDEDGNNLPMTCSRIGPIPVQDNEGNPVESEVFLVEAEQAIHDIIAEWVGYEQLPPLEELEEIPNG